jgi:argininosuccinate lyase
MSWNSSLMPMNEPIKTDWERFGRAKKSEALEITELNSWRRSLRTFDVASYYCQVKIHLAHTVMLAEQGIITKQEASRIIEGVKKVAEFAENDITLVGYMSTETALIRLIGEVGGKMHIGRSRNDLGHAQRRLYFRDQTERLIGSIKEFKRCLLNKAEENVNTIMPGYTHIRQSQPVTLAHYILAHVEAAARSVERLEGVYKRTNLNTLGAAALAGTSWKVDRNRTMELLGFDALCENSTDSVATIDYVIELASAVAIHLTQLGRLAEDLQIWSSDEYNMIDLDEAYAGTSSIMPQKKNPLEFEYIKSYSAESIGNLVSTLASIKGVTYTNTVDRILLEPVALDTAVGSTNVMAGAVATLTPKKDVMMKNLGEGFTTATDLADTLVRSHNLSFRQAHDVIVDVVVKALDQGKRAYEIDPKMVEDSAQKVIGRRLELSSEELASALDLQQNLMRRSTVGGPAPDSVRAMIRNGHTRLGQQEGRRNERLARIREAEERLNLAEGHLTP